ncbi:MAG: hypothetical protein ACKVQK_15530 [Burkholderiales bacterium]
MQGSIICAALSLSAITLLNGCIGLYDRQSEAQFNTDIDLAGVCSFVWSADRANYRIANYNGLAWVNASQRGYPELESCSKTLLPRCPEGLIKTIAPAQLTTHYLESATPELGVAKALPIGAINLRDYDAKPTQRRSLYWACVETTTPIGPRRAALAQGSLQVSGTGDGPIVTSPSLRQYEKERLLRELTQQAWVKLWTPQQGLPPGQGCREALDAKVKV